MRLADRLERLGTESAFEVSRQAAQWEAQGNRVYPFHLGDINLATPQGIVDAMNKAIRNGKTGYCPPAGIPQLRAVLADDIGRRRGVEYESDNVAIQPGGKPVISKFILALMNRGDEVLYPTPGYPIYESQIEFHGGVAVPYAYREEGEKFTVDIDEIRSRITPRTRLLVYNNYQNPTGAESRQEEMEALAEIALKHDLWILADEAYYEIRYSGSPRSIVSLPGMRERTVILYAFSKKFAMTGWRIGAAVGPREVVNVISQLNVNDESCTNHFIQWAVIEALTGSQEGPRGIISILKERRDTAVAKLQSIEGITISVPNSTFYLYPNVTKIVTRKGFDTIDGFQREVLRETGVAFCTRNHFGRPQPDETDFYVRFAYSGIDSRDISQGLAVFKEYAER